MINQATLLGNLANDPVIRTMGNGSSVANLRLITNKSWKNKQTGEWEEKTTGHKVTVYGPLVKTIERRGKKGATVFVQGELGYRKWDDENGVTRYSTEIVVSGNNSTLRFTDKPKSSTASDDPEVIDNGRSDPKPSSSPYAGAGYSSNDGFENSFQ